MTLSPSKQKTLENIVSDLKSIEQVAAIVLGGSHCTGMAGEQSDLDIGIYYQPGNPFTIEAFKTIAQKYHTGENLTITGFYQWGNWVNGGAWLSTSSGEVDILYRNIEQVKDTIKKCKKGIWENDFEQQPPYGFSSVIYLAEIHYCLPLYDPQEMIKRLKEEVAHYPADLKKSIVQQSLWSAEFSLWQADKCAGRQDIYNTAGCLTRVLKNIIFTLFALNEMYFIGDKYAVQQLMQAEICPAHLPEKINAALQLQSDHLQENSDKLRHLFNEVVELSGNMYHPYFEL